MHLRKGLQEGLRADMLMARSALGVPVCRPGKQRFWALNNRWRDDNHGRVIRNKKRLSSQARTIATHFDCDSHMIYILAPFVAFP